MLIRELNVDDIECDESILVFNITKEVDSINFKNAIIQLKQLPIKLPDFEKDIEEMIIEEGYGNDYYGNLIIQNYPNLQSIVVKKNSLSNLNSLMICNCEKLKTIEIEDGDRYEGAFNNVKNVIIESISHYYSDVYIFLIYNHSKQDMIHSLKQQVYLYQVENSYSYLCRCSFHKWRIPFHVN